MSDRDVCQFIEVQYRNGSEGFVDDITLNELIVSNRIRQFYRPFEQRWVDVDLDPVRRGTNRYRGPERRAPAKDDQLRNKRAGGLLGRLFRRRRKPVRPRPPPAPATQLRA